MPITDRELPAWPTDHPQADFGEYYVATMLPGATTIQLGLSATFVATKAAFVLKNSSTSTANPVRLYPKFLKLCQAVAPTAGIDLRYAIVLDAADRTPTTLAAVASPATVTAYVPAVVCTNMDLSPTPAGVAYFPLSTAAGATPTIPAAGATARTVVGNGYLKSSIPVVKDEYILQFGSCDMGGTFQSAAALACLVEHAPPVVIGAGQAMVIYLWSASNITAGNAWDDVQLGWVEK